MLGCHWLTVLEGWTRRLAVNPLRVFYFERWSKDRGASESPPTSRCWLWSNPGGRSLLSKDVREDVLEESFELLKTRNQLTSLSRRPGEKFDSLFVLSEQSHGDISINLVKWSVTGRIELHFLPRDVETDDLCRSPQTPSSQLERACVSIYFPVSPSPLFRTQTLCAQAAGGFCSGWCRFFFPPNLPLLTASEKQTLFDRRWYLRAAP